MRPLKRLLTRKRLRRLHARLVGPPTLVIPGPVRSRHQQRLDTQKRRKAEAEALREAHLRDSFLWGDWEVSERRPLWSACHNGLTGVSDYGTHLYKMIYQPSNGGKRSTITYNASEAHQQLVGMLRNGQGQPYPETI